MAEIPNPRLPADDLNGPLPEALPLGGLNRLFLKGTPPVDVYRPPQTPEQWHELALLSMETLAELGRDKVARTGMKLDPNQSVPIDAMGTATINYHEDQTSEGPDPEMIVKIQPTPRLGTPPANAPWSVMQAAVDRYNTEVAEQTEIEWNSKNPNVIRVTRRDPSKTINDVGENRLAPIFRYAQEDTEEALKGHARDAAERALGSSLSSEELAAIGKDLSPRLEELSDEEQERFGEVIRGVAAAAVINAGRPDLLAPLQNIWEPDQ